MLAEIYALAEGGEDDMLFRFYYLEEQRRFSVWLAKTPREVLVFADFMIDSQEYGVDFATGEVFVVAVAPYLIAPSMKLSSSATSLTASSFCRSLSPRPHDRAERIHRFNQRHRPHSRWSRSIHTGSSLIDACSSLASTDGLRLANLNSISLRSDARRPSRCPLARMASTAVGACQPRSPCERPPG